MAVSKSLSAQVCEFAKRDFLCSKGPGRQIPGTVSGVVLTIFLLVMAGLASAQTPMAYDFLGSFWSWGTIDLTTGTFSQTGNSGQLFGGIGVGPGGLCCCMEAFSQARLCTK